MYVFFLVHYVISLLKNVIYIYIYIDLHLLVYFLRTHTQYVDMHLCPCHSSKFTDVSDSKVVGHQSVSNLRLCQSLLESWNVAHVVAVVQGTDQGRSEINHQNGVSEQCFALPLRSWSMWLLGWCLVLFTGDPGSSPAPILGLYDFHFGIQTCCHRVVC